MKVTLQTVWEPTLISNGSQKQNMSILTTLIVGFGGCRWVFLIVELESLFVKAMLLNLENMFINRLNLCKKLAKHLCGFPYLCKHAFFCLK